jgi:hypothetical protein
MVGADGQHAADGEHENGGAGEEFALIHGD